MDLGRDCIAVEARMRGLRDARNGSWPLGFGVGPVLTRRSFYRAGPCLPLPPTLTPPTRTNDDDDPTHPAAHMPTTTLRDHQVILDCALPGPPARPNSLLLRDRAARAFSLICLCARPTLTSPVVVGGLVSLLRCREGDAVGGAATAALWALCRVPENRKTFAKTRCEWRALLLSCLV